MNKHQEYLMTCPSVPKAPYCPVCGVAGPTTEHHIVPRAQGGEDGPTIHLCGHGTAGCHGKAEDNLLHFDYDSSALHLGYDSSAWVRDRWLWSETNHPAKDVQYWPNSTHNSGAWHLVNIYNEYNQSIPFSEGGEDEGDKVHDLTSQLKELAHTANTLDYFVGVLLTELATVVSKEELKFLVEEVFGLSPKTVPSFISRRKKIARFDEQYAYLGLSKLLLLSDAIEKSELPMEALLVDLKVLSTNDFAIQHLGRKEKSVTRHECPSCGALHASKKEE